MNTPATPKRCAIYTRKSSEEGLEQSFNSLDAQREACEAFAKSQAHEGWTVRSEQYDDGGFSGGTMERPALTRLLRDIEQGQIDVVIVYKVDRLSRSLADFVRLIELFDRTGVSFVSVTQQFNTSTSMGRLTLNVLLSFAQFEREVTSERIRDKIAASKKKGLWMGGRVPLGYDRVDKQLAVNDAEADVVRHIHTRYLALGCVRALKGELDANGYRSKPRPDHHHVAGDRPFSRGALYTILKNPVYIGKVAHRGELHDGCHAAILNRKLWEEVQAKLSRNRYDKKTKVGSRHPSLLGGLVYDDRGNRMSPTYTRRKHKHYPYYISQAVLQYRENDQGSVIRVPGEALDQIVGDLLTQFLRDPHRMITALDGFVLSANTIEHGVTNAAELASTWENATSKTRIPLAQQLLARVEVSRSKVSVSVQLPALVNLILNDDHDGPPLNGTPLLVLEREVQLRRSGIETKLVYAEGPDPEPHPRTTQAVQEALKQALQWNQALLQGEVGSIEELADRDGMSVRHIRRLRRLAFLAPDIMERILAGTLPDGVTLDRLKQDIPIDWQEQRTLFAIR